MTEAPPAEEPKYDFAPGMKVRLRDNADAVVREFLEEEFGEIQEFEVFEVIRHDDEGGDAIYIGKPGQNAEDALPVSEKHLRPALNA